MTAAEAFDRIACDYDSLWTDSNVGRAQREQVWRVADRYFLPGERVLDLGCGTGEDTRHLLERRVRVRAFDASAAMVGIAQARGVSAQVLEIEQISSIHGSWDGALSNFGALNCVRDLGSVAASLARLIRPGGHALVCLVNRTCVWEPGKPRRSGLHSLGLFVDYPTARSIARSFAPSFELIESRAIGLFVPPSRIRLGRRAARFADRADRFFAGLPGLRALGDHRLFLFRRRSQ